MSDINALLWRKVQDGKQYNGLIPPSNCTQKNVGIGMTDLSVKQMAEMVKVSLIDTAAIAPLFSKSSLKETCAAIYGFVYNHFQYKADKAIQYLRSPSCSWSVRYDGIDCKSYSIIASSILSNLGLTHYIRQIKQPGFMPEMWTHVYIVVPIDQKTGSLDKGHYTIDGTVATMNEPLYIKKSDLKMSMQHIALRGAQPPTGLGISLNDIKGIIGGGWSPSCIGGTYDANVFSKTVAQVAPWYDDMFYAINDAIRNNAPIFDLVNKLLKNTQQMYEHSYWTARHDWKSKCSAEATRGYGDLGVWYKNIVMLAFLPWLEQYFNITYTTLTGVKKGEFEIPISFKKEDFNEGTIDVKMLQSIQMKPTTHEIKRFEITPYIADTENHHGSFNILQFMSGLTTTLASFNNPGATPPATNNPTTTTPGGVKTTPNISPIKNIGTLPIKKPVGVNDNKKVEQSSFGTVGYVLLAGAGIWAISAITKKKPSTSKAK